MAGIASEESGVGKSVQAISSRQRCQSGEALAGRRSSEQVENGTPSTSPPYWDTDDDDDGGKFLFLVRSLSSSLIQNFNFFHCISLCIFLIPNNF